MLLPAILRELGVWARALVGVKYILLNSLSVGRIVLTTDDGYRTKAL